MCSMCFSPSPPLSAEKREGRNLFFLHFTIPKPYCIWHFKMRIISEIDRSGLVFVACILSDKFIAVLINFLHVPDFVPIPYWRIMKIGKSLSLLIFSTSIWLLFFFIIVAVGAAAEMLNVFFEFNLHFIFMLSHSWTECFRNILKIHTSIIMLTYIHFVSEIFHQSSDYRQNVNWMKKKKRNENLKTSFFFAWIYDGID